MNKRTVHVSSVKSHSNRGAHINDTIIADHNIVNFKSVDRAVVRDVTTELGSPEAGDNHPCKPRFDNGLLAKDPTHVTFPDLAISGVDHLGGIESDCPSLPCNR